MSTTTSTSHLVLVLGRGVAGSARVQSMLMPHAMVYRIRQPPFSVYEMSGHWHKVGPCSSPPFLTPLISALIAGGGRGVQA